MARNFDYKHTLTLDAGNVIAENDGDTVLIEVRRNETETAMRYLTVDETRELNNYLTDWLKYADSEYKE